MPGLALQFVLDAIAAWPRPSPLDLAATTLGFDRADVGAAPAEPEPPRSIAYFIAWLDANSKELRHAYRHHHGLCRRPDACRAGYGTRTRLERAERELAFAHEQATTVPRADWTDVDDAERARVRAAIRASLDYGGGA